MKSTIIRKTGILLAMMLTLHITATGSESKAYQTGIFVFCGKEIPKSFSYIIEKKTGTNTWKPVAELKAPESEAACKASLMQLPAVIEAVTPVSQSTIAFVWEKIKKSVTVDSLHIYSTDPRYQYVAGTGWFDDGIRESGNYSYRIKRLNKNGTLSQISEISVPFPAKQPELKAAPVRFKLNENSISISYEVSNPALTSGIELYRSAYLTNNFQKVPAKLLYTRQKDKMVAVLTDETATKGLTYSYRAQPYDALANKGFMSDTLNIYFVAKAADIGLITKFQAFPQPEKAGNLLQWEFDYRMNVNTIDIYRCEEYDGKYELIASVSPKTREYFDSKNITPSRVNYYYIAINTGVGSSLPSPRVPAILEGKKPNNIAPQDLVATRTGNVVTLKFRSVDSDTRAFYIYRGDGYTAPLEQLPRMLLSDSAELTYNDTLPSTMNAAVYSYAVASVNSSYNISPKSKRANITYSGGRLPVPNDVNAMMSNNAVLLTWSDAAKTHSGVTGYRIFRKAEYNNQIETPEQVIAETGFSNNSLIDSLVIPARYYTYRVQCMGEDTADTGSLSQQAGILYKGDRLLQPGNVTAIPSDKKIILKWTLPVADNLLSALIYRSVENGEPILLKETDAKTEFFEDTAAASGTMYYYFIVLKYKHNLTSTPTDAVGAKW